MSCVPGGGVGRLNIGRLDADRKAPESLDADKDEVGGAGDANLQEFRIDATVGGEEARVLFRLEDVIVIPEGSTTMNVLLY